MPSTCEAMGIWDGWCAEQQLLGPQKRDPTTTGAKSEFRDQLQSDTVSQPLIFCPEGPHRSGWGLCGESDSVLQDASWYKLGHPQPLPKTLWRRRWHRRQRCLRDGPPSRCSGTARPPHPPPSAATIRADGHRQPRRRRSRARSILVALLRITRHAMRASPWSDRTCPAM